MAQYDGQIIINTKIDDSGLKKGVTELESTTVNSLKRVKSAIAAVVGGLSAAAIVKGIYSTTSALESSIARASTLFGGMNVDVDNLRKRLIDLSNETVLASDALGDALTEALSSGVPATEDMSTALAFVEQNTKLAKAGFTDIGTTGSATTSILNAYKLGLGDTDRIHKILIQTQNLGATTVGALGHSLAQVTPTAAAFGVSFEEIGAALSVMTAQGTPTAEATTQVNRVINELGKSGTQAAKNLSKATEAAGLGSKSFSELKAEGYDLGQILQLLRDYAEQSGLSVIDMFSMIDAGKGALSLTGQNLESFIAALAAMSTETDVVGEGYEKVMDTVEQQVARLKEAFKNLGAAIGAPIMKDLTAFVSSMTGVVTDFMGMVNDISDGTITWEEAFNSLADRLLSFVNDRLSPLLTEAASLFPQILGKIIDKIAEYGPSFVASGVSLVANMATGIVTNLPALLTAMVNAVLEIPKALYNNREQFLNSGADLLSAIWDGIQSIGADFFANVGVIFGGIVTLWDDIDWSALGMDMLSRYGRVFVSAAGSGIRYQAFFRRCGTA
jgi:TP901 family phage tail tape measure protein